LVVDLGPGSALCYLPDPVQPFEGSCFVQEQVYNLVQAPSGNENGVTGRGAASLCALDWVSQGRAARGENWRIWKYGSRNEVYSTPAVTEQTSKKKRLLLRDNVVLEDPSSNTTKTYSEAPTGFASRLANLGVFGTLILHGPLFTNLSNYFTDEFKALPRIGAKKWHTNESESESDSEIQTSVIEANKKATEAKRARRQKQEIKDNLLWTASNVRGFVVVKFGAREVEGVKRWLYGMLEKDGSVRREFGERALLCLK